MGGLGTGFNIIKLALQEQRTVSKLSDDFIKTFSNDIYTCVVLLEEI